MAWGISADDVQKRLEWLIKNSTDERPLYSLFTHQLGVHFNRAHGLADLARIVEPTYALDRIQQHIRENAKSMHEMIWAPNQHTIQQYLNGLNHIDKAIEITQPVQGISPKYPEIYFALSTGKFGHQLEWETEPTTQMKGMLEHELHRLYLNERHEQFTEKPNVPILRTKESLVDTIITPILDKHPNSKFSITGTSQDMEHSERGVVELYLAIQGDDASASLPTSDGVTIQKYDDTYIIKTAYDYQIGGYLVRGYISPEYQQPEH